MIFLLCDNNHYSKMYDRISDFYDGKSIFVTGASGFLGSVLLEILLRCLPGIKHVYVLLRSKKGKDPQERKNIIFRKKIFEKLLNESPDITDKVKVVSGDISLPHLGISEEDLHQITQEVSIVFHCAAMLTFKLPFKVAIKANTLGTRSVIELCRKLKKCEVLVYTSTIYSHTHSNDKLIEEKIYGLPFPLKTVLSDLENKDDQWFSQFLSKYNCEWPNSYVFSKCLAENMICEEATDLPVVICRPSIIFSALKGSTQGYVETGFGIFQGVLALGSGMSSVYLCKKIKIHLIPVDVVVNTLVASSWLLVNNRYSSPLIFNCTCGEFWNVNTHGLLEIFRNFFSKNVLPNSFRSPSWMVSENIFHYYMFRVYKDFIPCFVFDAVSYLKGKKLRLMPIQREIDSLNVTISFFSSTKVDFNIDTLKNIPNLLHSEDNKIFYTDLSGTKFEDVVNNLSSCSNLFNWKKDKLSPNSRKYSAFVNTMITTFIKRFSLFLFIGLTYLIIYKTFL